MSGERLLIIGKGEDYDLPRLGKTRKQLFTLKQRIFSLSVRKQKDCELITSRRGEIDGFPSTWKYTLPIDRGMISSHRQERVFLGRGKYKQLLSMGRFYFACCRKKRIWKIIICRRKGFQGNYDLLYLGGISRQEYNKSPSTGKVFSFTHLSDAR